MTIISYMYIYVKTVPWKKPVKTVMVKNSTNIYKTNNVIHIFKKKIHLAASTEDTIVSLNGF